MKQPSSSKYDGSPRSSSVLLEAAAGEEHRTFFSSRDYSRAARWREFRRKVALMLLVLAIFMMAGCGVLAWLDESDTALAAFGLSGCTALIILAYLAPRRHA